MKQIDRVQRDSNLNSKQIHCDKYCVYIVVTIGFLLGPCLLLLGQNDQVHAQEANIHEDSATVTNNNSESNQNLKITFNSIKINNDHDLLYEAEWRLDAYVNGVIIPLIANSSNRVESGQTVTFPEGEKSVKVQVKEDGNLRLITLGIEFDSKTDQLKNYIPDISSILDNSLPLSEDKDKSHFAIEPLTAFDKNDAIGIVAKEFTVKDNFGKNMKHEYCSESSGEAGDLYDVVDTNCDFRLKFTIE